MDEKQLPRDEFERDLFSRVLRATFDGWDRLGRPLSVSLEREPNARGEWQIGIAPIAAPVAGEAFSVADLLAGFDPDASVDTPPSSVTGWAYIAERRGRAVPMYRVDPADQPAPWRRYLPDFEQVREATDGPSVDWDGTDFGMRPAGDQPAAEAAGTQ